MKDGMEALRLCAEGDDESPKIVGNMLHWLSVVTVFWQFVMADH